MSNNFAKNFGLKKLFLTSAFLFFSFFLSAQKPDSAITPIRSPVAEYFYEKGFFPGNSFYNGTDTSLNNIQKYLQSDGWAFFNNFPYSMGLANRKLFFEPSTETGFRSGLESLNLFGYNRDKIKYYRARTPYTEIFALFGQKKEQYAKLLHTQNITKQWNIALNMLRFHSEGFYNRQNCSDNNISLSSGYTSKNNRYSLLANGILSSIKADENGGVRNDTVFENNLFVNKKLIPVNLSDARSRRGNREFTVAQFLNFGKRDSIRGDSTARYRIHPKSSFSWSFHANEKWFVYDDKNPTSGYYKNIFFDSVRTLDSAHVFTFQNVISLKSFLTKNSSSEISLGQETSHIVQYVSDSFKAVDSLVKENSIRLGIGKNMHRLFLPGFYWKAGAQYIVSGNNEGNFFAFGNLSYTFSDHKKISFRLENSLHPAPFVYSMYTSNHFWWISSFDKVYETTGKFSYFDSIHKFSVGVCRNQITGHVFFDSTFFPSQFDSSITIFSGFVSKKSHFKKICFYNKIIFQKSSNKNIIRLPQIVTNHSLYYEDKWFRKLTDVQIGFDITYFSAWYADAYMPALGLYHVQNEKKIGNYPFVDFFFSMKVKRVRFFFKTEHVNSGLMGVYYLAPHNPAPDRSIKVGINWTFYD